MVDLGCEWAGGYGLECREFIVGKGHTFEFSNFLRPMIGSLTTEWKYGTDNVIDWQNLFSSPYTLRCPEEYLPHRRFDGGMENSSHADAISGKRNRYDRIGIL